MDNIEKVGDVFLNIYVAYPDRTSEKIRSLYVHNKGTLIADIREKARLVSFNHLSKIDVQLLLDEARLQHYNIVIPDTYFNFKGLNTILLPLMQSGEINAIDLDLILDSVFSVPELCQPNQNNKYLDVTERDLFSSGITLAQAKEYAIQDEFWQTRLKTYPNSSSFSLVLTANEFFDFESTKNRLPSYLYPVYQQAIRKEIGGLSVQNLWQNKAERFKEAKVAVSLNDDEGNLDISVRTNGIVISYFGMSANDFAKQPEYVANKLKECLAICETSIHTKSDETLDLSYDNQDNIISVTWDKSNGTYSRKELDEFNELTAYLYDTNPEVLVQFDETYKQIFLPLSAFFDSKTMHAVMDEHHYNALVRKFIKSKLMLDYGQYAANRIEVKVATSLEKNLFDINDLEIEVKIPNELQDVCARVKEKFPTFNDLQKDVAHTTLYLYPDTLAGKVATEELIPSIKFNAKSEFNRSVVSADVIRKAIQDAKSMIKKTNTLDESITWPSARYAMSPLPKFDVQDQKQLDTLKNRLAHFLSDEFEGKHTDAKASMNWKEIDKASELLASKVSENNAPVITVHRETQGDDYVYTQYAPLIDKHQIFSKESIMVKDYWQNRVDGLRQHLKRLQYTDARIEDVIENVTWIEYDENAIILKYGKDQKDVMTIPFDNRTEPTYSNSNAMNAELGLQKSEEKSLFQYANSIASTVFGVSLSLSKESAIRIAGVIVTNVALKAVEDWAAHKVMRSLQEGRLKRALTSGRLKKLGLNKWLTNREQNKFAKTIAYKASRAAALHLTAKAVENLPGLPDYLRNGISSHIRSVNRLENSIALASAGPEIAVYLNNALKQIGAADLAKEIIALPAGK